MDELEYRARMERGQPCYMMTDWTRGKQYYGVDRKDVSQQYMQDVLKERKERMVLKERKGRMLVFLVGTLGGFGIGYALGLRNRRY